MELVWGKWEMNEICSVGELIKASHAGEPVGMRMMLTGSGGQRRRMRQAAVAMPHNARLWGALDWGYAVHHPAHPECVYAPKWKCFLTSAAQPDSRSETVREIKQETLHGAYEPPLHSLPPLDITSHTSSLSRSSTAFCHVKVTMRSKQPHTEAERVVWHVSHTLLNIKLLSFGAVFI